MAYEPRLVADLWQPGRFSGQPQDAALPWKRRFFALRADLLRIRESAGR